MKNLSVALLAAAALSTTAMANSGFYLGASAGVAQTSAKYSYNTPNPIVSSTSEYPASSLQKSFSADTGKTAGLFGLFAGYGALVGSGIYVGGEIYGGFDTTNFKPYNDSASGNVVGTWQTSLKKNTYYGLAARFGVMATPSTLIYLRLAAEAGKWKATVTPNAATINNGLTGSVGGGGSSSTSLAASTKSKSEIQFAPGAGVEVYLNKNLFVRAEYSYLFGPKINLTQYTTGYPILTVSSPTVTHQLKTSQQSMKVGIGYKF